MSLLSQLPTPGAIDQAGLPAFVQRAVQSLREHGLPTKKTEAWRFTPVRNLVATQLPVEEAVLCKSLPEGVVEMDQAEALGTLAPSTHFAGLNAAAHRGAVLLKAEKSPTTPLELHHQGSASEQSAQHPRVLLEVAPNVSLTLVETFRGESALCNQVLEILLHPGARLEHVRLQDDAGHLIGHVSVRQHRDSYYRAHAITFGGKLTRLDLHVDLHEKGAECDLRGAYHVDERALADYHVRVDHHAPHCTSRQDFRGLLDGHGTAVFDGQAIVHRTGGGAEAHQVSRNLLLSERANAFAKPHLEIDHDDVVASHGATIGALDANEIFYLRSRGISEDEARAMLTFAFVRAIVDTLPVESIRAELIDQLAARIHRDGISALAEPLEL